MKHEASGNLCSRCNDPHPKELISLREALRSGQDACLAPREGNMFNVLSDLKNFMASRGLHGVWIRAHQAKNAPLILVWIDPAMSAKMLTPTSPSSAKPRPSMPS
jgi:hypothetical protein